jgi:hypothetical protein
VKEFESIIDGEDLEECCKSFINMAIATGLPLELCRLFIEDEFRKNIAGK